MLVNSVHVIKPGIELTIEGYSGSFFSYSKQQKNVSGLNIDITRLKAIQALSEEIQNTFSQEFNEKLNKTINSDFLIF